MKTNAGDENVEVKRSRIEGLGLFALRSFETGQCIRRINVVREITAGAPLREDLGERLDHCDYPNGKVVLLGFPDRHVNHSCDPNAYVRYEETACYLYARKIIKAGDEITCDYNMNITGGTSWPCHCGAERCRGETLGDFFRLPREIQREYRPYLADWFVRVHAKQLDELTKEEKYTGGGYQVEFIQTPRYLHAIVTGRNSKENVKMYFADVMRECRTSNVTSLLIEERLEGPRLNATEVFSIVHEGASRFLGMMKAVAYVDVCAEGDLMHFAENVAVNRAFPLKVLPTVEDAKQWLDRILQRGNE